VLGKLDALGVLDDTIVVFTADHGECFDHGIFFEHADCLYDGAAKVPLLVRYPHQVRAGTRVAAQVEHLDVAPTILALAGVATPPEFRGRALLPSPPATADGFSPASFALVEHPLYQDKNAIERSRKQERIRSVAGMPTREIVTDRPSSAVRGSTWKLITDGPANELYDLPDDPAVQRRCRTKSRRRTAGDRRCTARDRHCAP